MNSFASSRRAGAFTLVELLTVIAIIAILAALLLPVLSRGQLRAKRIWCESNLEQMGIAFHTFANDHNGKFPMMVSTNDGGSMEFVQDGYSAGVTFYSAFQHFQPLAGELGTTKILICPTDTRLAAPYFIRLENENVSYFVGVDADAGKPASLLAGDRNLTANSVQNPTILQIGAGSWVRWTRELHQFRGNVLFADGHVEEWNNSALASAANNSPAAASLFLPSVKPVTNLPAAGFAGSGPGPSFSPIPTATTRPVSPPPGSQSNRPSGISSGRNKEFNKTQPAPAGPENPPATSKANSTAPVAPTGGMVAPDGTTDSMMSPFDRHLVGFLKRFVEWSYLLLLLLLLLYLAYKLWQRARQKAEQRRKALLESANQESTLDSDSSLR